MNHHILGVILFILTICIGLLSTRSGAESPGIQPAQAVSETFVAESRSTDVDTSPGPEEPTLSSQEGDSHSEETRIESFSDDRQIGRSGKNKIEIRCFSRGSERLAELKFYSRSEYGSWFEVQSFKFEKDGVTDCNPTVEDFNNDGLKDLTYESQVAARGANEVRKLFIYDKDEDELVYIKNSENYPNLAYNKKLNCVDAWAFHGSTTTIFLRIERDMLKKFASVHTGLERMVTVTRKDGTEVIIRREPMNEEDIYTRYSTFNPPS